MSQIAEVARLRFLWGYKPRNGDVVMDIGAGVGEEVLMFSREVGELGKVICVQGHPRTYSCLEKLIKYNSPHKRHCHSTFIGGTLLQYGKNRGLR